MVGLAGALGCEQADMTIARPQTMKADLPLKVLWINDSGLLIPFSGMLTA